LSQEWQDLLSQSLRSLLKEKQKNKAACAKMAIVRVQEKTHM
jgi:hypothetical protein